MNGQKAMRKLIKEILCEQEGELENDAGDNQATGGNELFDYYKLFAEIAHGHMGDVFETLFDNKLSNLEKLEEIHDEIIHYFKELKQLKYPTELNESGIRKIIRHTISEEESKSSNAFSNDDKKLLELANGMLMAVYDAATDGATMPEERINKMVNLFQKYSQEKGQLKSSI